MQFTIYGIGTYMKDYHTSIIMNASPKFQKIAHTNTLRWISNG